MTDTPPPQRRNGSIVLGIGIALAPFVARLGLHFALNYGPLAPSVEGENELANLLRVGAVDIQAIFGVVAVITVLLLVIPRTRRTGAGAAIGLLIVAAVMAALLALVIEGLKHFTLF